MNISWKRSHCWFWITNPNFVYLFRIRTTPGPSFAFPRRGLRLTTVLSRLDVNLGYIVRVTRADLVSVFTKSISSSSQGMTRYRHLPPGYSQGRCKRKLVRPTCGVCPLPPFVEEQGSDPLGLHLTGFTGLLLHAFPPYLSQSLPSY